MAKYRKFPFGYRMEFGKVVIDPDESKWVIYIFEQYILGESFKSISDTLKDAGISYDADKLWNKNIVARILQDRRYKGEGKFPQIIDTYVFQMVDQKRSQKAADIQLTKSQKMLKKKCGYQVTPHLEYEVLYLLNTLAGKPEQIEIPNIHPKDTSSVETLQAELEKLLVVLPVDETQARQKLIETTVAMYEAIDPREYETQRLKRIFGREQRRSKLDSNLLEQCISDVTIDSTGRVRLRLKNDQIVERGECNE